MTAQQKAVLIISAVENELALGTKHYRDGRLITTPLEIIKALKDNKLMIEPMLERRRLFGS